TNDAAFSSSLNNAEAETNSNNANRRTTFLLGNIGFLSFLKLRFGGLRGPPNPESGRATENRLPRSRKRLLCQEPIKSRCKYSHVKYLHFPMLHERFRSAGIGICAV